MQTKLYNANAVAVTGLRWVAAQRALLHRALCNRAARRGQYRADREADVR